MTAAGNCWKRSHSDLEEGDECLPISKRICSLHIESQNQGLQPQCPDGRLPDYPRNVLNGLAGSPVNSCPTSQFYSACPVSPAGPVPNGGLLYPARLPALAEAAHFCDQEQAYVSSQLPFFPCTSDPAFHAQSQGLGVNPFFDAHHQAFYSQQMPPAVLSALEPGAAQPIHHGDGQATQTILHASQPDVRSHLHADPSGSLTLPDYDFHTQQLPSGTYQPELGVEQNPFYYSVNQTLYEAHVYRVRRATSQHSCT